MQQKLPSSAEAKFKFIFKFEFKASLSMLDKDKLLTFELLAGGGDWWPTLGNSSEAAMPRAFEWPREKFMCLALPDPLPTSSFARYQSEVFTKLKLKCVKLRSHLRGEKKEKKRKRKEFFYSISKWDRNTFVQFPSLFDLRRPRPKTLITTQSSLEITNGGRGPHQNPQIPPLQNPSPNPNPPDLNLPRSLSGAPASRASPVFFLLLLPPKPIFRLPILPAKLAKP